MFKCLRGLFGKKLSTKATENGDQTPAGEIELTTEILPKISRDDILNCRRIIHRTSSVLAKKIIRERQIFSKNSAVSFSVNPGQTFQAEHGGAMLVFEWSGPIRDHGNAKPDELLHVLSPNYIESLIDRPSRRGFLILIGLIEPDLIEVADADRDFEGKTHRIMNSHVKVFSEQIVIDVI